jgi:hypothetical protein
MSAFAVTDEIKAKRLQAEKDAARIAIESDLLLVMDHCAMMTPKGYAMATLLFDVLVKRGTNFRERFGGGR